MNDYTTWLNFAHTLADEARLITLNYFRQPLSVDLKSDSSPVTIADKTTEMRLRQLIHQRYPNHGIIGEEHADKASDSEYQWIIDPIDGTKNFISGYPLFGTLICLLKNGEPVVSIIDIPAQDERFFATAETPTYYQKGHQSVSVMKTQSQTTLVETTLFSTDYTMFNHTEQQQLQSLRQSVQMVRYNGDCYLYAMLAAGWIGLVVESDLKVYDYLPLILIVEQAGGVISDWQGQRLTVNSCGQVLASANKLLHHAALAAIQASSSNE